MSKRKRPFEVSKPIKKDKAAKKQPSKKDAAKDTPSGSSGIGQKKSVGFFADPGVRETIESIVVAVILALLFRAYEAEAFVIPTGSMAPTLQGRHVDIFCKECGHNFRVGASGENPDRRPARPTKGGKLVIDPEIEWYTGHATCPVCRYTHNLKRNIDGWKSNQDSFYGDRIIVSKFAYEVSDPKRWDVIVFKYPANPKQNYIKRLIGLPGETIKLEFGNVYSRNEEGKFDIQRKPHHKLKVMLQLVDDTFHISKSLKKVNWPSRWDEWGASSSEKSWSIDDSRQHPQYKLTVTDEEKWLRYKHVVPTTKDWLGYISRDELPPRLADFKGQLITDFYAYNYFVPQRISNPHTLDNWMELAVNEDGRYLTGKAGTHWVSDLAVECEANVASNSGTLKLDIVRSGTHYYCSIDVSSGEATLSTSNPDVGFVSNDTRVTENPAARTPIRGKGKYRIRYANCDDKLYLSVNEKVIQFDGPTEYFNFGSDPYPIPKYSESDPGDAQPIGIGGQEIDLSIDRIKVSRDIYYINTRTGSWPIVFEYQNYETTNTRAMPVFSSVSFSNTYSLPLRRMFEDPAQWDSEFAHDMFSRQIHSNPAYDYVLGPDQFMPLGDNSPSSLDARAWEEGHYVDRKFLIGKALFIYWPHAWRQPTFLPNFRRMGFIR